MADDDHEHRDTTTSLGGAKVKFLTANLWAGGIGRSRTETRYLKLLDLLAAQGAHVIAAQECLYWHENDFELFHMAELALGMRGVLGVEDTGMATALFVAPPLAITRSRVFEGGRSMPWRHGAVWAELALPGEQFMHVGSAHLSPRSRHQRLWEAEQISTWWKASGSSLVGMDANTADRDTDLSGPDVPDDLRAALIHPETNAIDTRPMDHLTRSGFIDLATRDKQTRVPTAGIGRGAETRCDRLFASPAIAERCGRVEIIDTCGLSDHLWATVTYTVPKLRNVRGLPTAG
jgi:endonuclease/exonuclease/phosphatase family metal-dependent hydrolase